MQQHRSILHHFDYENDGWIEIKNELKPPLYCIQSYERTFGDNVEIKTDALYHYKLDKIENILGIPEKFLSLYPDVVPIKVDNTHFVLRVGWIHEGKRSMMECDEKYIKEDKRIMRIQFNYSHTFVNHYIFCCEEYLQGTKFTVQISLKQNETNADLFCFYIQHERKFLYSLGEILRNSTEGYELINIEREFYKRLDQTFLYPKIIHTSEKMQIVSNEKMNEYIFVGESVHEKCVNVYMENVFDMRRSHPLFSKIVVIKKGVSTLVQHLESYLFDPKPTSTDVAFYVKKTEGSFFSGCQSIRCDCCPFGNHENEVSMVLSADCAELKGDGKLHSVFYIHFKLLSELPEKEKRIRFNCIFNAVLMDRICVENGIHFVPINNKESVFDLTKLYLSNALHFQVILLKKKRQQFLTMGECAKKGAFDFTRLDRKLILHIFNYLPLEDLVCCMATCKRFDRIIRNNQEIWKNFYDLYFNPTTFNKYNTVDSEITEPRKEYCYYQIVSKSKLNKTNWKLNWPITKRRIQVFDHFSVDFIFPFIGNNRYYVGSSEGRMKKFSYQTHHYFNEYVLTNSVVAMDVRMETKEIIFGMRDGTIRTYCDQSGQYDKILTVPYDKMKFIQKSNKLISWNGRKIGVYDTDKYLLIDDFSCHSASITYVDEIKQDLLLSSSEDQTILAFDYRSNKFTFQSPKMGSTITTFDSFDDYIVLGTHEGSISMYDMRMNNYILNRRPNNSPMTIIKCHNRKILFSQYDKIVSYYDCDKGWFKNLHNLYQHEDSITSIECNDSILMSGSKDGIMYYSQFQ